MIYDINVRISYRYGSPVLAGRHLVRLWPFAAGSDQTVHSAGLDVVPTPDDRSSFQDFFGNRASMAVFDSAHSEIDVQLRTRVERHERGGAGQGALAFGRLPEVLQAVRSLDPLSPLHFLGASGRARPSRLLHDYASDILPADVSVEDAVRLIGERLNADMVFDASATSVDTRHEDAFETRRGVCQDFSHIMIAALRSLSIPAGYVSGVLRTSPPPGQARLAGADAMHAWVRAWCGPDRGWVEYDPTNACWVAADHVVIARGRDYSDVSPIKGVLRAASSHVSSHSVDVIPVLESNDAPR